MTDSNNLIHSVITSDLIADKILPRDERSVYLQKFTESGWPTGKHEEWRFTSLNGFRNLAASEILNLQFDLESNESADIRIIDLPGKIVYSKKVQGESGTSNRSIDISTLPAGSYIVSVNTSSGNNRSKTFVKK